LDVKVHQYNFEVTIVSQMDEFRNTLLHQNISDRHLRTSSKMTKRAHTENEMPNGTWITVHPAFILR